MKKLLFVFLLIGASLPGYSQATVTNVGFTFSPDTVTINEGENVTWSLNSLHNAVEVSLATWNAQGTTSNGGFSMPFGGGTHTFNTAGTYYYVCQNHVLSSNMKGVVIVNPGNTIKENENDFSVSAYPTQVIDKLNIKLELKSAQTVRISVINLLGAELLAVNPSMYQAGEAFLNLDFSAFTNGVYFVKVMIGDRVRTIRVVK